MTTVLYPGLVGISLLRLSKKTLKNPFGLGISRGCLLASVDLEGWSERSLDKGEGTSKKILVLRFGERRCSEHGGCCV